jgi:tetratricopeptide (TPR) repeat protein
MVCELGLHAGQYLTREDDGLGELQLQAIADAVEQCRFTVLVASSAARWDTLAQFAAGLAQHAGLEDQTPRLIIIARDFAPTSNAERTRLSLAQRALVGLDCSDETSTVAALARLRKLLALEAPVNERPPCPYPGLARFTAANRELLFGRDQDRDNLVQRIRAGHSRLLIVGPSGSGKSSLIHAAVLPELPSVDHVVQIVPRGDNLAAGLRGVADALEVPELGAVLDSYVTTVRGATDAQIAEARAGLRAVPIPDGRRRVVVVDPLEEVFAEVDAASRETLFSLLGGLWSLSWCTVILCIRADFYGALMVERCWRELEHSQYTVAPLDERSLRAAIVEPARSAGVHIDMALAERLIRESDRDRSSSPLPLLQIALKVLWAHLRWRYLTLVDYERIVNHDQRGLAAVLAVHAEAALQALPGPGDRGVAQRILLDLVHLGEGRPHTRRRRTLEDLRRSGDAPGQLERVLEKLVEARLVTTSDGGRTTRRVDRAHEDDAEDAQSSDADLAAEVNERHVDLAHDVLITGWPALTDWIAERCDELLIQRRYEARAASGELLRGSKLEDAIRWLEWIDTPAGQALGATDNVRSWVRRSVAARRRRRGVLAVAAAALTTIAIIFVFLFGQLREEKTRAQRSISKAVDTANLLVFEVAPNLQKVASTSPVRTRLLMSSRELLDELSNLGELSQCDQRTQTISKAAQGALALERGGLAEAQALYLEVFRDAQRRANSNLCNAVWQGDLAFSYANLGDVAMAAGKLKDALTWFEKSFAIFEQLAAADPTEITWQRDLSVASGRLGDVAMAAGKLENARAWFGKSLAIAEKLAGADQTNTTLQRDLAVSYTKLGNIAISADRLEDARAWVIKGLAVRNGLATADPTNTVWQSDLSVSYMNLGHVAESAGKLEDARAWFTKGLAVRNSLATADPTNTAWQSDLADTHDRLGDVAMSVGKLEDAHAWFTKGLAIRQVLATTAPSNTTWQRDLALSYEKLGDVERYARKFENARVWFIKGLMVRQVLAAADPTNTDWQDDLAVSFWKLGDIAAWAGALEDAHAWFSKSLAVVETLAAAAPTNTGWQRDLAVDHTSLGEIAVSMGKLDDARAWFAKGLAVRQKLIAADSANVRWQRDLSISYERLGEIARAAGDVEDARAWFDKSLTVRTSLAASDPTNTTWQHDLTVSYDRLGELALSTGKLKDARAWFDKSLTARKLLVTADPTDTEWQHSLSASYWKLGEIAALLGKREEMRAWFGKSLAIAEDLAAADPKNAFWQRNLYATLVPVALVARDVDEAAQYLGKARIICDRLQRGGFFQSKEFAQMGNALDQLLARINIRGQRGQRPSPRQRAAP